VEGGGARGPIRLRAPGERQGARASAAARPGSFYWLETRTVYVEQFGAPLVRFTRTTH
jgi:hypothetical protein